MVSRRDLEHDPVPSRIIGGNVYHKPKGDSYASGCNAQKIRELGDHWEGIDLDLRINEQRRGEVFHQLYPTKRDAWFDPKGKINDRSNVQHMTNAECDRMRVKYKGRNRYHLHDKKAMQICKNNGKIPCFEGKGDPGRHLMFDPNWWEGFRNRSIAVGVIPVVMALPYKEAGIKLLAAAHEAGCVTCLLWRSDYPKSWNVHLDLVKSHKGRPIYRV